MALLFSCLALYDQHYLSIDLSIYLSIYHSNNIFIRSYTLLYIQLLL